MPIDYKKYPPNWKTEIVPAVLKRANDCCEECKLENGSLIYSVSFSIRDGEGKYKTRRIWFRHFHDALRESIYDGTDMKPVIVVLTVAHLDHDETNTDVSLDRLKALCQSCHLRYDAKEKYRRQVDKWNSSASNTTL